MKLYALFYYDRPLLESWLNHYVQFGCIEEIIIQDQNWSVRDSQYLMETVARYIDEYDKKIVILPSSFIRLKDQNKRSQFITYGQSVIRNRVTQFLQNQTFIASSMDEVIYKNSYKYTEEQLREFERLTEKRAPKRTTIGFIPLYCAWLDGIHPCNGIPIKRLSRPQWRHRLFRFVIPFRRKQSLVHDTTYQTFKKGIGKWVKATPSSCLPNRKAVEKYKNAFPLDLNLIHYHTLVHPDFDSPKYVLPSIDSIQKQEAHPKHYLERMNLKPKPKKPVKQHPRMEYWRRIIAENRKHKRNWFHGLPYKWWYGLSGDAFLKRLPEHLDKKKEPRWWQDKK